MSAVKTGAGAGIGATIGFFTGFGPIGAGIGALIGGVVAARLSKPSGEMTPRRRLIYTRAMESIKTPADLNTLADSFAGEGLHTEANMLRKRASLRSLPPQLAESRRVILRKAMASDNVQAIRDIASQFANQGSTDAAKMLFNHAIAVEAAHLAGASTRPVSMKMLEMFADKLARAIGHFPDVDGAPSRQAMSAAANLIRAQGKLATKDAVLELIDLAKGTLSEEAAAEAKAATDTTPVAPAAPATSDIEETTPVAANPPAAAAVASTPAAAVVAAAIEPAMKVRVANEPAADVEDPPAEPLQSRAAVVN
jgi:hypothetical protein